MENKIPYDLISKHLGGETSEHEDELLWKWIEADTRHLSIFQELVEAYTGASTDSTGWENQKNEILSRIGTKEKVGLKRNIVWKIAASVLILCVAGIYGYKKKQLRVIEVKTLAGEVRKFTLPDSTSIWLNSNTIIRYTQADFLEHRKIELTGEAFFKVNPIEGSEFHVVYDSTILITDAGEFTVQSYALKKEKTVTISEGAAKFVDLRKDDLIIKGTTGQRVVSLEGYGVLSLEINQDMNFNSWLTGTYAFNNTPASVIAELLSKDQGVELHIPDKDLRYQFLTGIYEQYNAEKLMLQLMKELDATLEVRDHAYYLIKNKHSSMDIRNDENHQS